MATDWKASLPKKRLSKRFKFNGGSQYLGNTGTGENNTVEPSKPTAMLNTGLGPRLVHEGEDMRRLANGDIQVIPASQSQLQQAERDGMQGFALGGVLRQDRTHPASNVASALNDAQTNTGIAMDNIRSSLDGMTNPFQQQVVSGPELNAAPVVSGPELNAAPVSTGTTQTYASGIPYNPDVIQQTATPPPPMGLGTDSPVAPVSTGTTTYDSNPPAPSQGDRAVAMGLGGLEAYAAGESPVDRTIANRTLGNLGAQQEAERMAAIQGQAQQGVTGPAAQAQQAMLGISQGSQMAQAAGDLAITAQERAFGATRDLATIGQAQQAQEFAQGMAQVGFLVDNGDFAGAAQAFQQITGNGADLSNAETMFNEALLGQKANRVGAIVNNLTSMLPYLDEDTAAGVGALLSKVQMGAVETIGSDLLNEDDWTDLDAFFTGDGDPPISDSSQQYIKTANEAISAVADSDNWLNLQLERPELFDGSDENTITLGKVAGALIRQNNGTLTDDARSTLEEYGLYNSTMDIQDISATTNVTATRTAITDAVGLGNLGEAERLWEELSDEETGGQSFSQHLAGTLTSLLAPNGSLLTTDQATLQAIVDEDSPQLMAAPISWNPQDMMHWVNPSGAGNAHWELKPQLISWLDAGNIGKIMTYPGTDRHYIITGYNQTSGDNEDQRGYITVYDVERGTSKNIGHDYDRPFFDWWDAAPSE